MREVKVWKKTTLTKEEMEKAFDNDEFRLYIYMLIEKLVEEKMKEGVKEDNEAVSVQRQ